MSGLGVAGGALQVALVVAGSPLLVGVMRQVRARMEGRYGPGVGQPWRDLRKLLEMAIYELDGTLEAGLPEARSYPGGMSGSLGTYEYTLTVAEADGPCRVE